MTAAEALQAAANLLGQARRYQDGLEPNLALGLAVEATGWALVAMAIEGGVPPPDTTQASPDADPYLA